jgi:hypothetical protein
MADSYDIRLISSGWAIFTKWNVPVQPNSLIEFINKDLDSPLYAHAGVEYADYFSLGWGFGSAGGFVFNPQMGVIIHPINLEILADAGLLSFFNGYTLGGLANYYLNNWFGFGAGGGISFMVVVDRDRGDRIFGPYIRGGIFAHLDRMMKFSVTTDYFVNTGGIQVNLLVSIPLFSLTSRTARHVELRNRNRDSRQKMRP